MNRIITASALLLTLSPPAVAQAKLDGSFTASRDCPAVVSIKKGTNPGDVSVSAGQSYKLVGKNKDEASHYWIDVPGAEPSRRWVAVGCGKTGEAASADEAPETTEPTEEKRGGLDRFYVLALSWQPGFCEGLPDKLECTSQTAQRFDATHFTLHGLWPQPRRVAFCNVAADQVDAAENHRWQDLPPVKLTPETRRRLEQVMPGAQSYLDRHEWTKHGTCYPGGSQEQYFKDALRIADAVNGSAVQHFFADHIGKVVKTTEIRAQFNEAFGNGAGQRVRVACKSDGNRRVITEITIGLKGDLTSGTPVADLIQASTPTDAGCPQGVIDRVGLQ